MVNWYKHDIPAWMDSTESLPDGAYRVHHVICQLIYLNEGPIRLNEHGISGRCNMHILAFRKHLDLLVTSGRLTLNPDQTLSQPRANLELTRIGRNRVNAGLGGDARAKSLKNNNVGLAPLKNTSSHKTREDKTREEKKEGAAAPVVSLFPEPSAPDVAYYARSREIFGKDGGWLAKKLLTAKKDVISDARAVLEACATKDNPKSYVLGAMKPAVKNGGMPESWVHGDDFG